MEILIIDDDQTYMIYVKAVLGSVISEFNIKWAPNGKDALDMLSDFTPDLIICDKEMPEMGGYEAISKIRDTQRLSKVPILMNSSDEDITTKLKAIQCGADVFHVKPINQTQVNVFLDKCLKNVAA